MKNKTGIEGLLVTTSEEIVLALLEGPLQNNVLAERVNLSQQHLSRILPRLKDHHLIVSRFVSRRRENKLTSKGVRIAEAVLEKKKALDSKLDEKELRECELWIGGRAGRTW